MDNNKHDAKSPESEATSIIAPSVTTDETSLPPTSSSETQAKADAVKPTNTTINTPALTKSSWAIRFSILFALGLTLGAIGGGYVLYQQLQQQIQQQQLAQDEKTMPCKAN